VKSDINSIEVHPQLSIDGHPVDGALVGADVHCGPKSEPGCISGSSSVTHDFV